MPVRRAATRSGGGSKSIRIHVLELLAADDRDFGMAEIIERIHSLGVRAHDDAVRSITVKLMKDGTVLRVGRGRYRLAERPANPTSDGGAGPHRAGPHDLVGRRSPRALNLAQPWNRPEG